MERELVLWRLSEIPYWTTCCKLVALKKRITALGIASWGFVGNKAALVSPDVKNFNITNIPK